jgi:hypothetical protein
MGICMTQTPERSDSKDSTPYSTTTGDQTREAIILDTRVRHLLGPLAEAGFEVTVLGHDQRTSIPPRQPGPAQHLPILVTASFRDWVMPGESSMKLGANLVNVKPILGHPEGCATVLVRALTEDVPKHSLMWVDFDPSGQRHLVLFVAE